MKNTNKKKECLTSDLVECGHCSVKAKMKVITEGEETYFHEIAPGFDEDEWFKWQILICLACDKVNVRQFYSTSYQEFQLDDEKWIRPTETKLLYPLLKESEREAIFQEGQHFDAQVSLSKIINQANHTLKIIDNYIDTSILNMISVNSQNPNIEILTKNIKNEKQFLTLAQAFKKQYGNLSVRRSSAFHDRFLMIDDTDLYHFGSSLKDLGNKTFMFSKIEEPRIQSFLLDQWKFEWSKSEEIF